MSEVMKFFVLLLAPSSFWGGRNRLHESRTNHNNQLTQSVRFLMKEVSDNILERDLRFFRLVPSVHGVPVLKCGLRCAAIRSFESSGGCAT